MGQSSHLSSVGLPAGRPGWSLVLFCLPPTIFSLHPATATRALAACREPVIASHLCCRWPSEELSRQKLHLLSQAGQTAHCSCRNIVVVTLWSEGVVCAPMTAGP